MGWDFFCDPRKGKDAAVKEVISNHSYINTETGNTCRVSAYSVVGNHLWMVVEGDYEGKPFKEIVLGLLESGGRDMGWGYKCIAESSGPAYYDCPLKYLEQAPPAGSYGPGWRESVREYHRNKRAASGLRNALKAGCVLTYADKRYVLMRENVRNNRKAGWYVKDVATDQLFIMKGRVLSEALKGPIECSATAH